MVWSERGSIPVASQEGDFLSPGNSFRLKKNKTNKPTKPRKENCYQTTDKGDLDGIPTASI